MRLQSSRRAVALVAALTLAVVVGTPSIATANDGHDRSHPFRGTSRHDQTFIAMLMPHHRDAVDMATLAEHRAVDAQVRRLAAHIVDEQSAQIDEMRAWMHRNGVAELPPPVPVQEMAQQDRQMLRAARGTQVDELFLMMMRPHHAQAVSEAEDELLHGRNSFALDMARSTKADQAVEIAEMNRLLDMVMEPH